MIKIKLRRKGKKHYATYRVIVAQARDTVHGNALEDLGYYNPHTKEISVDTESAQEWIKKGAQPTDTVRYVLYKAGLNLESSAKKSVKK
jgi:small subunit ribosomal protein S16